MGVVNYKQILDALYMIVIDHKMLKGNFYVGKNYEALEDERNTMRFPLIQVKPMSSELLHINENKASYPSLIISLNFSCLDIVNKNESNKIQVYNDTLQHLQDIISFLCNHPWFEENKLKVRGDSIIFLPEEYTTTSNTCGWNCNIAFRIDNWDGYCGLPIDDVGGWVETNKGYYVVNLNDILWQSGSVLINEIKTINVYMEWQEKEY